MSARRSMALLAAVPLALALPHPATATAAPPVAQTPWRTCSAAGTECAELTLPVDWGDPGGETFAFAVARHRATDPAQKVGTLIFGPGGPGDSGRDRLTVPRNLERFSDELLRRFDIVSFDPRGVGASGAMPCPVDGSPVLQDAAAFEARIERNRTAWAACRQQYGAAWEHAGTDSTVRDLDALRRALGERQLTFHGSSYGTLLGQLYAERYPARVRAMVLESAVDHSGGTGSFLRDQAWALQDSFDAFADWCAGPATCALDGTDVHAAWAEVSRRAERGELNLSPWDLTATAHRALYRPDYAGLAATIEELLRTGQGTKESAPIPVTAVFCADWALPVRDYAEYRRLLDGARTRDFRYSAGVLAIGACLGWPGPVTSPQHRAGVRTRTPLLQLAARHDPASGWNWARSVARQLGRSGVLLTYAGAGHGSYGRSACMEAATDTYLIGLRLPERGTVCPAVG